MRGFGGLADADGMAGPVSPHHSVTQAEDREWWREAVTMALYVGLSLLAVLAALPAEAAAEEAGLTVLLTAVGLLLAHQVAFRLSTQLVNHGLLDEAGRQLLAAQLSGGVAIAIVAALPVFLLGAPGVWVAEFVLLGIIVAAGYIAARGAGRSAGRAIAYVLALVVVVALVLLVKSLVGH